MSMGRYHSDSNFSSIKISNSINNLTRASVFSSIGSQNSIERPWKVEDLMFDLLRDEKTDKVSIHNFFQLIEETGIQLTDPRIAGLLDKVGELEKSVYMRTATLDEDMPRNALLLDRTQFGELVDPNLSFISRVLEHELAIPNWPDFSKRIEQIFTKCQDIKTGKVADYIPQLGRCDPNLWGMALCTIDGQILSLGDSKTKFTMQASQYPLAYAVVRNHCYEQFNVHDYVGMEPSGLPYKSMALNKDRKPHNPLISTGAIVVASLIKPDLTLSDRFDFLINKYRELAGGRYIGFNNSAFLSERCSSDRNFAIGHILKENNCFPKNSSFTDTLDFYFQMCSIETHCDAGCLIAATFANGGICPLTSKRVMSPESVRSTLSLMSSVGMYDFSGQFSFHMGLPAKSCISGALLLVVPNVCGICLYSPALDEYSNSVRAVQFCYDLVGQFNFHTYDNFLEVEGKIDPRFKPYEASAHTALTIFYAAYYNDASALRRAYLRGYTMSLKDYDDRTALHIAASEGHMQTVKFLVEICGLSPTDKDRWGFTPLLEAQRFGRHEVEQYLLKYIETSKLKTVNETSVLTLSSPTSDTASKS